jgi:glutamate 5-kinase
MTTKLAAAKLATEAGIDMVITNGAQPKNLYIAVHGGQAGTLFQATKGR